MKIRQHRLQIAKILLWERHCSCTLQRHQDPGSEAHTATHMQLHPAAAPKLQSAHCHTHLSAAPCNSTSAQAPKPTRPHTCSGTLHQHQHPSSKAHAATHIWQRHPAAAPAPKLQSPHGHTHIWQRHPAAAPAPEPCLHRAHSQLTRAQPAHTRTASTHHRPVSSTCAASS